MPIQEPVVEEIKKEAIDKASTWQTFEIELLVNFRGVREGKVAKSLVIHLISLNQSLRKLKKKSKISWKACTCVETTQEIHSNHLEKLQQDMDP